MLELLESAHFAPYIGQSFCVPVEGMDPIPLELIRVQEWGEPQASGRRQPFTLEFFGPASDVYLQQATYRLEHSHMGALDIFLVPLGSKGGRMRYEAVFA